MAGLPKTRLLVINTMLECIFRKVMKMSGAIHTFSVCPSMLKVMLLHCSFAVFQADVVLHVSFPCLTAHAHIRIIDHVAHHLRKLGDYFGGIVDLE